MSSPTPPIGRRMRDGLRGMRFLVRHGTGQLGRQAAALPGAARLLDRLQEAAGHSPIGPLLQPRRHDATSLSPRLLAGLSAAPRDAAWEARLAPLLERLLHAVLARLGIDNAFVSAERMARAASLLRQEALPGAEVPEAERLPAFWAAAARALAGAAPLRDFDLPETAEDPLAALRRAPEEATMLAAGLAGALVERGVAAGAAIDSALLVVAARLPEARAALQAEDGVALAAEYAAVLPFLP